jgi:phosphoglycerate dehydrogenase-like enzyme
VAADHLVIAVSGIPRGYQFPRKDGRWLQDHHRARILEVAPHVELREIPAYEVRDVDDVEILLAEGGNRVHYHGELDWPDYQRFFTRSLKWVQLCSTGFSDNITPQVRDGSVALTNAPGLHTTAIAESVLAAMLDHVKRLKARRRHQQRHAWVPLAADELEGRVALIVGLGRIGQRVAGLCRGFGMTVVGTKRSPAALAHVDTVFPPDDLHAHLPAADFVVLAAPHTPETVGLLGRAELAALKPSAYLINVGRGSTVDEGALVDALTGGRLAGAYLDAFTEEPLPDTHPLWDLDNVLVVPHDSHSSPHIGDRTVDLFCANLRRYVAGLPLEHVCDPARGY